MVLDLVQAKHPCLVHTQSSREVIPNDTRLGAADGEAAGGDAEGRVLLLTGPNMGGKSTLLRQTCLIAIMAQVGCFVPADECRLTPVDRVFTRLGASDRILAGQVREWLGGCWVLRGILR